MEAENSELFAEALTEVSHQEGRRQAMPTHETKAESFVTVIDWNGVSYTTEMVSGGLQRVWTGAGPHAITVHHSDGSSQKIVGKTKIVVMHYTGYSYDFSGD